MPLWHRQANGCLVGAVQQPGAARAALIVEVAAGSHDEPPAWPGLAHLLEHLLFLGGAGYLAEQRLLPFVQACAGRVNASTRARHSEYHCEVPAALLEEAGLRLLDMMVRPRLAADELVGESQVLEAEYQARAADPQQQGLSALLAGLADSHPCRAFVAGNAASLAPRPAELQQALSDFHRRFYRAGACRLLLVGPQGAADLLALGERLAQQLDGAAAPACEAVPALLPLRAAHWQLGQSGGPPRIWLGLVFEKRDADLRAHLQLLGERLASALPGGLLHGLRQAGLADELRVLPAYQHAGQALLALELLPGVSGAQRCARVRGAVLDWLRQGAAAESWSAWLSARAQALPWRLASLAPLELGRFWLTEERGALAPDAAGMAALLQGFTPQQLLSVQAETGLQLDSSEACGFHLPLQAATLAEQTGALPLLPCGGNPLLAPVSFNAVAPAPALQQVSCAGTQAVLLLRWQFRAAAPGLAAQLLLRETQEAARELGLQLAGQPCATAWQLRIQGAAALLPQALQQSLQSLRASVPAAELARLQTQQALRTAGEMPIRRLLQWLPQILLADAADTGALPADWDTARWQGLLVGPQSIGPALPALPGVPEPGTPRALLASGRHWHQLPATAGDSALLLFCPLPSPQVADEACWRLLGRLLAPAFHQRLRVELQLGYGLFCGYHEVDGQGGLLFAVQSAKAVPAELLAQIEAFLASQCVRLALLSLDQLHSVSRQLQQDLQAQGAVELAALLWPHCLAGHGPARLAALCAALPALTATALAEALAALIQEQSPWLLLACPTI
ncbi:coenzyme PQQ biosynthesis protein PqqF [Pseudomonas alcaligenes]|uniref:Coenzyme PQQ biosynthesis protein PqqF n=1 Tax=Aquipseudomonas alcaligenes TaxID=43263 RepID=A0ABR7RYI2_AQUAC|nr:coenzyme PQQ biosynthesis protein PqqF [Pseudomonas alcaligenes]